MTNETRAEVNVEQIMREIRMKIQMDEELENLPTFEDIPIRGEVAGAEEAEPDIEMQCAQLDLSRIEGSLQYINAGYDIPYYWSFGPAGIKTFLKRVVRKLAKCLIPPILEKQNRFNAHVVNCLNALRDLFSRANAQTAEIAALRRELSSYREETEKQIQFLREQYREETQKQIAALRETLTGDTAIQIAALREMLTEDTASQITALRETLTEDTASQIMVLREKNDAFDRMIAHNGNSIKTLQSTTVGELRDMIKLNENSINALKGDMDCIRRVDASIFNDGSQDNCKYGQAGEDSIVAHILTMMGIRPGHISYLDLGANHARDLSNTYYFYTCGAGGVLVEANPNLIPELKLLRSRDVILNNCVANTDDDVVDFYVMSGDGLSTNSKVSADQFSFVDPQVKVTETVQVKTISVNTILDRYFSHTPTLLNIDIEGGEMDVLTSLDFEKYRPMVIIVETIPYEPKLVVGKKNNEVVSFLQGKGYIEYAFTGINSIFVDAKKVNGEAYKSDHIAGTDYTQNMLMNELGVQSSYGICLKPGGIAYGPYISCATGEYRLEVKVVLFDNDCPAYLNITAEAGTEQIGQFALKNGVNHLHFSLKNDVGQVEFVLQNQTNDNMYLTSVHLQRE